MRAVIIGGGIGGLTAAIALRRSGIEPEVYERAPEPREVGAGISLWGNALVALKAVGADGPVMARGEVMTQFRVRTWRGRVLKSSTAARLENGIGVPAILMIHRAELLEALLSQLPAGIVRFGHECLCVGQDQDGARALMRTSGDDVRVSADVLIGADGVNSRVRAGLLGATSARYSGYTCWRGVATVPESLIPAGHVEEIWGRGQRFGICRIGGGRVYWWACLNSPPGGADDDAKSRLARDFANWTSPVPAVIEATDGPAILRNDIVDRPPVGSWGAGRITLLGDAAHPMTPNLGQGGCTAIEDGVVLATCLKDAPRVAPALRAYERARCSRTSAIVKDSYRFGHAAQWRSPLACWARDTTIRLLPTGYMLRRQRALMKFKP